MTSIVIVGGGLMGLSAALHLRRLDSGVRVSVLERQRAGAAASGASAAGVRVTGRHPAERALALAALARWPELDRDLDGRTGYRRGGGLRVAMAEAAWRAVPGWVAEQRAEGVPVEVVDAGDARRLAPGVAPGCLGGVHCPIDGQAEAMATVGAFAAAARRAGARIEEGVGARALAVHDGRMVGVERSDGWRETADVTILAAGAWTAPLLAAHGVTLPVETRALQMLLTEPGAPMLEPVIACFDRKLSLKQLEDGRYLIGGGWRARIVDEAANRWELLDESVAASLDVAGAVHPPTGGCALDRGWAGLEAFLPDDLPALGPLPGLEGALVAAGFSGHGFALAPVVGEILARLALGRDSLGHLWSGLRADRAGLTGIRQAPAAPAR